MATGAAKTDTFLGERYRRLIKRMPKAKASAAIERSILTIIFQLLSDPTSKFNDLEAKNAAPAPSCTSSRSSATRSP